MARSKTPPPASPDPQLRTDQGLLYNALSRLGTRDTRTQQTRTGERRTMRAPQLDVLWQSKMVKRMAYELPQDASSPPKLSCADIDTQQVEDVLDDLNTSAQFVEAQALASHYGGAAVWVVMEGVDPAKPLKGQTIGKVKALQVIERFELSVQSTGATYYDTDPASPSFGLPMTYLYAPSQAGGVQVRDKEGGITTTTTPIIHADHLIRFYGDSVPRRLRGTYQGWGAPILEGVFDSWSQLEMAKLGGAELAHEFGMMVYSIPNLHELLSGNRMDEFFAWMQAQTLAKSTVRGLVMGAGQTAERSAIPLTGWVEIYDRLAQFLAAELGMPVVKLYGQAPGGLSTDDASAWRQWSRRVENYQTGALRGAYNRLLTLIFRSTEGPTRGQVPDRWMVEFEPYEVPSVKEEAETLNVLGDALTKLDALGAISQEEVRATIKMARGLSLSADEDFEAQAAQGEALLAGMMAAPPAQATASQKTGEGELDQIPSEGAPEEDVQKLALNGAQVQAMGATAKDVRAGLISPEQGAEILMIAYQIPREQAMRIAGQVDPAMAQAAAPVLQGDEEDSFVPPLGVIHNAKRALEVRAKMPPSQRGMTPVGLARARDLANGRPLSLDTLRRMVDYFTRHEVDKQGETWGEQGKGWQAWHGWGGDEGWRWARTIVEREDKRTDTLVADPYMGPDDDLPEHIASLSRDRRALWVKVWNATWRRTKDEGHAFAVANAAVGEGE